MSKKENINKRAYKIIMSKGQDIPIDADELPKAINAISTGSQAVLRSAIFNPSFYIAIVDDQKRNENWWLDTKHQREKREEGIPKLPDIFKNVDLGINKLQIKD